MKLNYEVRSGLGVAAVTAVTALGGYGLSGYLQQADIRPARESTAPAAHFGDQPQLSPRRAEMSPDTQLIVGSIAGAAALMVSSMATVTLRPGGPYRLQPAPEGQD